MVLGTELQLDVTLYFNILFDISKSASSKAKTIWMVINIGNPLLNPHI